MRRSTSRSRCWRVLGFALALSTPGNAQGVRVESSLGSTLLAQDGSWLRSVSVTSGLGYTFPQAAFGFELALNGWASARVRNPGVEWLEVATAGIWAEYLPLGQFTRTRLGAGVSQILLGPEEDPPHHPWGYLLDLRPLGFRLPLGARARTVIDPLTFTLLVADPGGIPLADIQFATRLSIEVGP
jgi:hypothetical protein